MSEKWQMLEEPHARRSERNFLVVCVSVCVSGSVSVYNTVLYYVCVDVWKSSFQFSQSQLFNAFKMKAKGKWIVTTFYWVFWVGELLESWICNNTTPSHGGELCTDSSGQQAYMEELVIVGGGCNNSPCPSMIIYYVI